MACMQAVSNQIATLMYTAPPTESSFTIKSEHQWQDLIVLRPEHTDMLIFGLLFYSASLAFLPNILLPVPIIIFLVQCHAFILMTSTFRKARQHT